MLVIDYILNKNCAMGIVWDVPNKVLLTMFNSNASFGLEKYFKTYYGAWL